jgi:hypothetical protein
MPTPTPEERSVAERIALLPAVERERIFAALTVEEAQRLYYDWAYWARPAQLPPPGTWIVWLILSGRGGGKTRTGAETIIHWSEDNDRMALVGRTAADVRDIMVEGESGILLRAGVESPELRALETQAQLAERRGRPLLRRGRAGPAPRPAAQEGLGR